MTVAAVILAVGRDDGSQRRRRTKPAGLGRTVAAAISAGLDETVVVIDDESLAGAIASSEATILLDDATVSSEASALRAAADYAARAGHEALVVALATAVESKVGRPTESRAWRQLADAGGTVVVATAHGRRVGLVRLDATVWPLLPIDGRVEALWRSRSELVTEQEVDEGDPSPLVGLDPGLDAADLAAVSELLGRAPTASFEVVVRDRAGGPVVIANAPFTASGEPMPTTYWLVGRREREAVGRLEASGGVRAAEAAIDPAALLEAHARYGTHRDMLVRATSHTSGPRPTGGVGGTRQGVKCLHAHLAWYLAGGQDPVGAWVVQQLDGAIDGPVAAIDCGTNSTRLLVLDRDGAVLAREMTITRLGEGVDRSGSLAPAAIERTVAALSVYRQRCDELGVVALHAVATSAARDAENSDELFDRAEQTLRKRPELLDGMEEGRLSYRGATADLEPSDGPFLVLDLGGGSTELVAGATNPDAAPVAAVSLALGCVRVTERFLKSDPPTSDEIAAARSYVRTVLEDALAKFPALAGPRLMVGVAGTVSTLAALDLSLAHYDAERVHHAELSRAAVEQLRDELGAETVATRRARPAIEAGRADVIVGGAIVLAEAMDVFGHDLLVHSELDILDGIATELRESLAALAR